MRYPKDHVSTWNWKKYRLERRAQRIADGLCTRCDNPATKGFKDCAECINNTKRRIKESREERQAAGNCIQCGKPSRPDALRCFGCTKRMNRLGKARHKGLKIHVLTHYGVGGKLQCYWEGCTVTDIDMLTLDHIENDGAEHRRGYTKSGRGGGNVLYDHLIREGYPAGFQTLCANHNLKKHIMTL